MANALGQLSSAEEALATLIAGPSAAEIAASRSAVTQAEAQLSGATNQEGATRDALTDAFDEFCERYDHVPDVRDETCAATLPLSDEQIAVLRESLVDGSSNYQRYGNSLINANVSFIGAAATRASAASTLASARERLDALLAPVSAEDREQAELAVEAARANHASAAARLDELQAGASVDDRYQAEQSVEAARANRAAAVARLEDLQEEPSEEDVRRAELALEAARANHVAAVARLEDLQAEASAEDVRQAELAVEAARANHAAAVARLEDLQAPADEGEVAQARSSLESAQASLASAQARHDELNAGATANAIAQQEESVRLAEISLEEARSALAELTVLAPFAGVVEAVNVQPGDRVTANLAAFSLSTSNRILIALTVTEADLLSLEVGQAGLATFDAIEDVQYPVRIASISRVPNAAQGVVTYDVQARLLAGPEIAEVAAEIAVLGSAAGSLAGFGTGAGAAAGGGAGAGEAATGAGGGGAGAGGGGLGAGGARGLLAQIELPEGVTIRDVLLAVANGEPLPEGVTLPEGFEIPPQLLQRFAGAALDALDGQAPREQQGALAARPLPAPGMSASVTILTELREPSVLVPVAAVRQLDGAWFVTMPTAASGEAEDGALTFERVSVEIGESDGVNVEITSGLEAGAVLLVGADSAGIAFSATQRQPQQLPQPGFGGGGGLRGGGFGGGGGGQ